MKQVNGEAKAVLNFELLWDLRVIKVVAVQLGASEILYRITCTIVCGYELLIAGPQTALDLA